MFYATMSYLTTHREKLQNNWKQDFVRKKTVHELELKKCVFGSGGWTKHNIDFYNLTVSAF